MKQNCPYCHNEKIYVAFLLDDNTKMYKCSKCKFIWKNKILTKEYYNKLGNVYYVAHNNELVVERRLSYLEKLLHTKYPLNILDFGGGDGYLLSKLPNIHKKTLVELSESGRVIASSKYNISTYMSLDDMPLSQKFDIITMYDVLEHIDNFNEIISNFKSKLKVEGVIIIETGITDSLWSKIAGNKWKYFYYDEHSFFFTKRLIDNLFIDGFDKIQGTVISHTDSFSPKLLKLITKVFLHKLFLGKEKWGNVLLPLFHDHYLGIYKKK